jgi:hypothetical protein
VHEAQRVPGRDVDAALRALAPLSTVMKNRKLSHGARRLMQHLWLRAGCQPGTLPVPIGETAVAIGAGNGSVSDWLAKLDELGLLHRYHDDGQTVHVDLYHPEQAISGRLVRPDPQQVLPELEEEGPVRVSEETRTGVRISEETRTGVRISEETRTPPSPPMPTVAAGDVARAYQAAAAAIDAHDPDPDALLSLAKKAYDKLYGLKRHAAENERLLLLRAAAVAMAHLGADWLLTAAAARPAAECRNRMAYFRGALALAACEGLTGQRAESRDDQAAARAHLAALLSRARVPGELLRRAPRDEPGEGDR